jgi:hypothetical protein
MTENYWEHESYGRENRDDKVVTVTLARPLTDEQFEALDNDGPQLDNLYPELGYCDGGTEGGVLGHDWENVENTPRGLIGYEISRTEIKIWGSEAIEPSYLMGAARYVLSETAKVPGLAETEVSCISTSGIAARYRLGTLTDAAESLDVAQRAYKAPEVKLESPNKGL